MRIPALLPTVFIASAAASLCAQEPRVTRIGPGTIVAPGRAFSFYSEEPRAIIGISTSSGATARDTAGVLVSSVRQGSPAERAGVEEGNRIASINGVSLKLSPTDVGDDQMSGVMIRRLSRELDKLKPGDEVDLRVVANGQTKSLKIKTVAPSDLAETRASTYRSDDRATLGVNLAITGSSRDTLGVFVMSVVDDGPAAKAGIEEGSRIASINGVDVRGRRTEDDDDYVFRTSNVSRLEREVSKAKPGDELDLRVYFNGQYRNVKVKAARYSDLPRRKSTLTIVGGDNFALPMAGGRGGFGVNSVEVGDQVRRALEMATTGMGRAFGRFGNRIDW
jgi:S1-C subfamily serine protease